MPDLLHVPLWVIEIVIATSVVATAMVVISEKREPTAALAWIFSILLLPGIGLFFYLIFGRGPHRRARRNPRSNASIEAIDSEWLRSGGLERLPPSRQSLVRLGLNAARAPMRLADDVCFVGGGAQGWRAISSDIEAARESIHLEFYIWRDDETGRRMTELLTARAREGISVRVLYDPLGSLGLQRSHFQSLIEAGGLVATSSPLFSQRLRRIHANYRNHRKLICIDDQVGFMGGVNIANEYLLESTKEGGWRDLIVRIEGNAATCLQDVFRGDWLDATDEVIHGNDHREHRRGPRHETASRADAPAVQVIPSGPDTRVGYSVASQVTASIASSNDRCWIATPYLIPDQALKLTLITAAMRGVDLRLLIPRNSDHRLVTMAARSYFDSLLQAGCRIYQYPEMFHAKYLVVDHDLSSIGSANMDIRSFQLNYEVTAIFYSEPVNSELASIFETDLEKSRELTIEDRAHESAADRTAEAFARLLSPLL